MALQVKCCLVLLVTLVVSELANAKSTAKLIDTLRDSDQTLINPLGNGEKLSLSLSVGCVRFDEQERVLTSRVWEKMSWTDSRLQWEPSDYSGVTEIHLKAWHIWTPDLTLYNSVESSRREPSDAIVSSTGLVNYIPFATYKTVCRPRGQNAHSCTLKLGSWTYDSVAMPLVKFGEGIYTGDYDQDCPYTISNARAQLISKKYECCENEYQSLNITFTIQPNDYRSGFKIHH